MYIKVSPRLDCYSVAAANISIEDLAVDLTIVILTVPIPGREQRNTAPPPTECVGSLSGKSRCGNREIQQTQFQMAVSLQ